MHVSLWVCTDTLVRTVRHVQEAFAQTHTVRCIRAACVHTLTAIIRSPYLKIRGNSENKASSKAERVRCGEWVGGCDGSYGEGVPLEEREWRNE